MVPVATKNEEYIPFWNILHLLFLFWGLERNGGGLVLGFNNRIASLTGLSTPLSHFVLGVPEVALDAAIVRCAEVTSGASFFGLTIFIGGFVACIGQGFIGHTGSFLIVIVITLIVVNRVAAAVSTS